MLWLWLWLGLRHVHGPDVTYRCLHGRRHRDPNHLGCTLGLWLGLGCMLGLGLGLGHDVPLPPWPPPP